MTHGDSPSPLAFLNGEFLAEHQARLPVTDLGIVSGATVTEMIRTFAHRPFMLPEHLDRLQTSVRLMRLPGPDFAAITAAIDRVCDHNTDLISADDDLGVIVFVTAGAHPGMLPPATAPGPAEPTVCVHSFPLPFHLWTKKYDQGLPLIVPATRALPPETLNPQAKFRSRLHWYIADQQARQAQPGAAALLTDARGRVTETSTGNLFVVRGGALHTPPDELVLGGISRIMIQSLAQQLGLPCQQSELTVADVLASEEAFLCSSGYCLLPVSQVNRQPIGTATPGSVTRRLLEAWNERVGIDIIGQAQAVAPRRWTTSALP